MPFKQKNETVCTCLVTMTNKHNEKVMKIKQKLGFDRKNEVFLFLIDNIKI